MYGTRLGFISSFIISFQFYIIQLWYFDATLAASYAQLSATALGYGACWVGGLSSNDVKNVLGIKNIKPICVIAIGKGEPDNKSNRKPQESIVDFL